MDKTAIIIPSRLDAVRLPNKPLELIKNKEMILHVYEAAQKTNTGDVYVATPVSYTHLTLPTKRIV